MTTVSTDKFGKLGVEIEPVENDIAVTLQGHGVRVTVTMPRESAEEILYALLAALEQDGNFDRGTH